MATERPADDRRHVQTLNTMLASAVAAHPDRPFFVSTEGTLSYAEFDRRACTVAAVLADQGVTAGDPVAALLPSRLELALTYWGAQKVGAVPLLLNPMFRAPEIARAVEVTGARLVLTDCAGDEQVARLGDAAPSSLIWTYGEARPDDLRAGRSVEHLLATAPATFEAASRRPDDAGCLFFTSGTTGKPKAVVQTQRNQVAAVTAMFVHNRMRFGAEVVLNVMPMFNNFGAHGVMLTCVFAGATMVVMERWDCDLALDLMTEQRVTMLLGTPTIFADLAERYDGARHDLGGLLTAVTGGAAAPPALIERFHDLTGVRLRQVYGATECCGPVTGEAEADRRTGSIGRAVGSVGVRILDDDGRPVAVREPGEIVVAGDMVSPGYLGDPEAQRAHTPQGWRSGDIGYVDEDGYFYLVDRRKDVVICGGNNVYPAEVEAVVAEHPAVLFCSVVGVPDERRGEVPVVAVVPRVGRDVDVDSVVAHCRERIAAFKVPRAVYVVAELPLGPTGKVLKNELREDILSGRLTPDLAAGSR